MALLGLRISATAERIGTKPLSSESRPFFQQKMCGTLLRHDAPSWRIRVTKFWNFLSFIIVVVLLLVFTTLVFQRSTENRWTDLNQTCFICKVTSVRIYDLIIRWPWPLTLTLTLTSLTEHFVNGSGKTAEPIHTELLLYARGPQCAFVIELWVTLIYNLDLDSVRHYPILHL